MATECGAEARVIEVLASSQQDERVQTFILHDEDHTLGNCLRWLMMKDSDVQFCGYTIPHPSQRQVHLRVQTYRRPAVEALRRALQRLGDVCDTVAERAANAAHQFRAEQQQQQQA